MPALQPDFRRPMSDLPSDPQAREKWWRISAIFAVASQLPPAERESMLPSLCASHPEDLDEIKALLAQHDAGSTVLDRPDPLGVHAVGTDVFAPDEQVGNYRVRSRLSTGGMGVLYLAEDNLRRLVVLKVLVPALAADPAQRQRLRHEAEAMARLKHPGIATVYAFDESRNIPFLVTEYVAGRNLRERLQSDGPYDPTELVDLAVAITEALCAAHAENIIHRDLKPENVMLPQTGGVKLIDFGIARFEDLETRLTQSGTVVGTLAYMSPEQIEGSRVDHRSDQFSLGVVLYEAATNSNPFVGHTKETTLTNILRLNPPPLSTRRPLTFGRMESIVARCLSKAPAKRYQSSQELLADLRAARRSDQEPLQPLPASRPAVGKTAAVWWWVMHQVAVSVAQGLLLIPLWLVRPAIQWADGRTLAFFVPLALVALSIVTRFHSAFIARNWRHSLARLRRLIAKRHAVVRIADTLFALSTATVALVVIRAKPGLAALLLSFALGLLTTLFVVEPVTMQDAFEDDDKDPRSDDSEPKDK